MRIRKQVIYLSLIAFILHFIWENTQAPLFQGYTSFSQHFLSCLMGTVGDVAITLAIYFVVALLKSNFNWIATLNKKDITILTTVGFFVAVGIELARPIVWRVGLCRCYAYHSIFKSWINAHSSDDHFAAIFSLPH